MVLRLGAGTALVLALVLTWLIGLPLARAVGDVLVMTSLDGSGTDSARVGHMSSPPIALEGAVDAPPPGVLPTGPPLVPTAQPPQVPPTSTARSSDHDPEPTRPSLRDQADRWTVHDRATATAKAIDAIAATLVPTPTTRVMRTAVADTLDDVQPAAGSTTILFLGLDAREGEGFIARSDAILVAHLDPEHNRVSMLSLPRDLWVTIPGAGQGKINSAFVIGEQVGAGAALAKETVGDVLGIAIDHVVVMDFTGFRSLVDALEGITIDVPTELYDPQFPTEDYGYTVAHFLPGRQLMDGEQALMYSRIRHPDSDFMRMRRQETVVLAIARRLRERGMLRNIREADRLTSALQPYMRTDMSPVVALNLLWSIRSVDLASIQYIAVDGGVLMETNIGGAYAVYADEGVLHELGTQLIDGE